MSDVAEPKPAPIRLGSIDAFRGLVMFLMMAEVLNLSRVARHFPGCEVMEFFRYHTSHVEWIGCSLHDLIQPSFSFLVGVALPFSMMNRSSAGQSKLWLTLHALWRSLLLIFLGIFLRSINQPQTRFTFEDTLSQIGLGYFFLYLLGYANQWIRGVALVAILVGYWALFATYPIPGPDDVIPAGVVPANWSHDFDGFLAHWNLNRNPAWAFDTWFLNLFSTTPFVANRGGYSTLSFIPTLGTMILGLMAGDLLRRDLSAVKKTLILLAAGAIGLASGIALEHFEICPIVKKIWTPAWVLYSGGWCFVMLATFYAIIDGLRFRAWAFPLVVIGMNSIFIYCVSHRFDAFVMSSFRTHLGSNVFKALGEEYEPILAGSAVLLTYWLILFWMYRQKFFVKI
jgi:heparan-alpha-glucosaminide N-acetyltransferase